MFVGEHMLRMKLFGLIKHLYESIMNVVSEQFNCMGIFRTYHKMNRKCIFMFNDIYTVGWPTYTATPKCILAWHLPSWSLRNHEFVRHTCKKIMITLCFTDGFLAVHTAHIYSIGAFNFRCEVSNVIEIATLKINQSAMLFHIPLIWLIIVCIKISVRAV
jgi:hypothetical protein